MSKEKSGVLNLQQTQPIRLEGKHLSTTNIALSLSPSAQYQLTRQTSQYLPTLVNVRSIHLGLFIPMIIFPSSYSMSLVTNSSYYCYLQRIKQTLSPQHHTHKGNPILFMHIKRSFQEVMYNVKKTILSCYGCMCTLGHKSHRPHSLYYMNYLCMYTSIVFCCD